VDLAQRLAAGRSVKLLVSVVSVDEARRALAGGADIIDVKDPSRGPLGAPAPDVLTEVVLAVGDAAPVSVALGDPPNVPAAAARAARGAELGGAHYVKVGLAAMAELDDATALIGAVKDAVSARTSVIAVAYADASALDPPALAPACLPALVERTGIAGALVDTHVKDGSGLYRWLSESELTDLIVRTHRAGGSFAVAGQLALGELRRVPADVAGVRSAVCRGGERVAALDADRVAAAVAEVRAGAVAGQAAVPEGRAGAPDQPGTIRVPAPPGARTTTVTPVPRTASGR
jgi:uncharacterized protein (UPF0264 family)